MTRLQKKCVVATAGIHLLLLTLLLVGPAFFNREPKATETHLLDVIPANLVDAALNSGVQNAVPPPPEPPAPQQIVTPPAPPPKPTVTPTPVPVPEKIEKPVKQPEPKPDSKLNLKLVTRTPPKNSQTKPDDSVAKAKAINTALKALKNNLSAPTEVNLSGNSSVAYANYATAVISVYHQAWPTVAPSDMDKDSAVIIFKVTITSDGSVINAQIVTPSGDTHVDSAVQKLLERVTFIAPFPEGAKEKQRDYTINFNATPKIE